MKRKIRGNTGQTVTIPEAAQMIGVCYSTALKEVKSGGLPTIKIGRRLLVLRDPLEQLLQMRRDAQESTIQ